MKKSTVPFFCLAIYFFVFNPQVYSQEAYYSQSFGPKRNNSDQESLYNKGSENKFSSYQKLFYNDLASTLNSIKSDLPGLSRSTLFIMAGALMSMEFVDSELSDKTFHENRNFSERKLDNVTRLTEHPLLIGLAGLTVGHVFKKDHFAEMGLKIME